MYGLPKIHKDNVPIRPIISAIGTYNYRLAKYLTEILTPLVSTGNRILKDSFDFVNRVSKIEINDTHYVVSFDVESLFTNIPTLENINILLDRAFADDARFFHGMTRETLEHLPQEDIHRSLS